MCMLLKMRGVPPRTQTDPETGFLIVNDRNESTASRWFESVKLTSEYTAGASARYVTVSNRHAFYR